jgi:hypothetical protein
MVTQAAEWARSTAGNSRLADCGREVEEPIVVFHECPARECLPGNTPGSGGAAVVTPKINPVEPPKDAKNVYINDRKPVAKSEASDGAGGVRAGVRKPG